MSNSKNQFKTTVIKKYFFKKKICSRVKIKFSKRFLN